VTSNDYKWRLLCVERSPEGNRVAPLEGYRESLEQEHGLSRLLRDSSDSSADLLDQLNGPVVPGTGSLGQTPNLYRYGPKVDLRKLTHFQ